MGFVNPDTILENTVTSPTSTRFWYVYVYVVTVRYLRVFVGALDSSLVTRFQEQLGKVAMLLARQILHIIIQFDAFSTEVRCSYKC